MKLGFTSTSKLVLDGDTHPLVFFSRSRVIFTRVNLNFVLRLLKVLQQLHIYKVQIRQKVLSLLYFVLFLLYIFLNNKNVFFFIFA